MNDTCVIFIKVLPEDVGNKYLLPKSKTISDRFDLICAQRRAEDKKNCKASGISEEEMELNSLLDDLILQRDEDDEAKRKVKEEKTALDKKLDHAANQIRDQATSQLSASKDEERTPRSQRRRSER